MARSVTPTISICSPSSTGVDANIIKEDAQMCYKATGGVSKDMPDTLEAHGLTFECGLSPDGRKMTTVGLRMD